MCLFQSLGLLESPFSASEELLFAGRDPHSALGMGEHATYVVKRGWGKRRVEMEAAGQLWVFYTQTDGSFLTSTLFLLPQSYYFLCCLLSYVCLFVY